MNRLADETSPYLLQHKDNPVDWYPWGEEARERARTEDKPILLSWDRKTWAYGLREELGLEIELEVELGWTLARDAWGHGYATEAAIAVRDWAFRELRPPRLISMIFPANVRSQRVAEKIGERFEREVVTASGKLTQLWST